MTPKSIFFIILTLFAVSSSWGQAPSEIVGKKVTVNGFVSELNISFNHQFFFVSSVNQVGRYNIGLGNEDWSLERYHYRKVGEQSAQLTIINYDGEQARLVLSFDSPTSGSVTGAYYDLEGNEQWSDLVDGTWTAEDFDRSEVPEDEMPADPSGYFAPVSIGDGALSAQDKYWPVYDETISFTSGGSFSANIINGEDDPTGSGSYSYSKTGTNSATLNYSVEEADYTFEYALQFTGENTGIYSKFADYGGGSTDITTGPFSLSGIAVPEQHDWEEYDDFSSGSLDSNKWTATNSYFLGNDPTFANGRVELTGLTSQHPHDNTFLIVKDLDGIVGVEADIWLPSDAPVDTGVLIGIADAGVPVGYLDLWGDGDNTRMYVYLENSTTNESIDFQRDAELGVIYKVGIIEEGDKTALYLNGEKVAEITTWQSENIDILFRGVNNVGSPFTAYLDNVRVIRNWEDYDDFSSGSLDSSKWDVWWGAGGALAVVENGALKLSGSGNESDPASSVIPDDLTYASNLPSKHSAALINQDDVYGVQAEFMIPANPSDDTGLNFAFFDWESDSSTLDQKQEFGPELEYRSESGLRTEFAYTDPESGQDEQITRPAEFGTYYKMSLINTDTTNSMYLNGELIKEFSSAGFEPDTIGFFAFNDDGLPYTTYVKNVRVLRRSQEATEPDPVTVVSDPNGNAVVVQVGDEYQWNSTLDGVTLWLVGNDSGSIMHATIKYEAGNYSGNFEFLDEVTDPLDTLSYAINENGYLAHTESLGQQYFQILSAEDGRIGTIGFMNDLSLANHSSEPTEFFFTTRAAAEEYYYSKANPKNWMWFDHYPWVYSEEEGDWLYFYPSGGILRYWSNKGKAWRQFN